MRLLLLLPVLALVACAGGDTPYSTTIGTIDAGRAMTVHVANAPVRVYKPASGDPENRFTVSAIAEPKSSPPPPTIRRDATGIVVNAPDPLRNLLVRVPDGVHLDIEAKQGDISITDVKAIADVSTGDGSITIMVPTYAQAQTQHGHVSVTIGATEWPGTLHIRNGNGDTEVWVNETAHFNVRMHTDDGVLFTDFPLRGTSQGHAETIDAPVNGGGPRAIDIEATKGTIRLLQLAPQA